MYTHPDQPKMKVARIYLRVSTETQDLTRQSGIEQDARAAGYYIAGVYREKASGSRADRPELLRMVADLQPGEIVIAEKIDRISRCPLPEAEKLIASIRNKGAKLAVPGLVDLSDLAAGTDGVARIVLESVQELLLRLALQMAREDYETRRERQRQGVQLAKVAGKYPGRMPDTSAHQRIVALRSAGHTIKRATELAGCSVSQVKRIWAIHQAKAQSTDIQPDQMAVVGARPLALIANQPDFEQSGLTQITSRIRLLFTSSLLFWRRERTTTCTHISHRLTAIFLFPFPSSVPGSVIAG